MTEGASEATGKSGGFIDQHGGFPQFEAADPGPGFGRFLDNMRRLQDLAVSANPDTRTWDDAADRVDKSQLSSNAAPCEGVRRIFGSR